MTTADVVVIGGGILGASTAYHLAGHGLRVVILERGAINREGSGTTAGNLHVQAIHSGRPGQKVPVDSARFLPLQKAASDRWQHVEDELGTSVEVQRAGGFMVAETDEQVTELRTKANWEAAAGIPTEVVDGDEARKELPLLGPTVAAATWCPLDGYANPLKITPAYLAAAQRRGAVLYSFCEVTGLKRAGGTWQVEAGSESFEAPAVIDVAGPWLQAVAALAGIELQMTPVAIQMHATTRVAPILPNLVQHIGEGMSVKQVAAGNLLIGGGWPSAHLDLNDRSPSSVKSLIGNVAQAVRILPFLREQRLLRMWSGPLAATPDEMPVIGPVPSHPGFYLAGGTYAFTFAPLWGETLAALVCEEQPPIDISDLGPDRLMTDGYTNSGHTTRRSPNS